MRVVFTITFVVLASQLPSQQPASSPVDYRRDIQPIFNTSCVGCHQVDGFGPMSLASYADARPWAKAIRDEGGEARKREDTPGHDSCIGSFGHAHYPSNG